MRGKEIKGNNMKVINPLYKVILWFFFVFDVPLRCLPTVLSSRKISLVLIILYVILGGKNNILERAKQIRDVIDKKTFYLYFAISIITVLSIPYTMYRMKASMVVDGIAEYLFAGYFLLFTLISSVVLLFFFNCIDEMCKVSECILLIQATFIYVEVKSEWLRKQLNHIILTTSNLDYDQTERAKGLGCSESYGTMVIFILMAVLLYFKFKSIEEKNLYRCVAVGTEFSYVILAQALVGRAGFAFSVLILGVGCVYLMRTGKIRKTSVLYLSILITGCLLYFVLRLPIGDESCSYILDRTLGYSLDKFYSKERTARGESTFIGDFTGPQLPDFSNRIFWGLGISEGSTKYEEFRHDSGYITRYVSNGFILATMEYVFTFLLLIYSAMKCDDTEARFVLWVGIIVFAIFEIKEPLIYRYIPITIMVVFEGLLRIEEFNNHENKLGK